MLLFKFMHHIIATFSSYIIRTFSSQNPDTGQRESFCNSAFRMSVILISKIINFEVAPVYYTQGQGKISFYDNILLCKK